MDTYILILFRILKIQHLQYDYIYCNRKIEKNKILNNMIHDNTLNDKILKDKRVKLKRSASCNNLTSSIIDKQISILNILNIKMKKLIIDNNNPECLTRLAYNSCSLHFKDNIKYKKIKNKLNF